MWGGEMGNIHFSSETDDWATPQDFFNSVAERFGGFDWDAAASLSNCKVSLDGHYLFYGLEHDALSKRWSHDGKKIWLNPPYGRVIGKFMAKAVEAYMDGCLVVCLVPARTDTGWWHDYVAPYAKVEFIRGRLKFGEAKNSAPFPSAIVIYDGRKPTESPKS